MKSVEGENVYLKQEIETLKRKPENTKASSVAKKRRKVDEDVIPVPKSPKTTKQVVTSRERSIIGSESHSDFDCSHIGEVGKASRLVSYLSSTKNC